MNDVQKQQIEKLRAKGLSYGMISKTTGISINTVKTYCKRNGFGRVTLEEKKEERSCLFCGESIIQVVGRKEKKFCSDRCRNKWWNEHLDRVKRKANYDFICGYCKKTFTAYGNAHRKYCSHECYIKDRFGGI